MAQRPLDVVCAYQFTHNSTALCKTINNSGLIEVPRRNQLILLGGFNTSLKAERSSAPPEDGQPGLPPACLLVPEKKQFVRSVEGRYVAGSGMRITSLWHIDSWAETDRAPTVSSYNDIDAAHATGRPFFSDALQSFRILHEVSLGVTGPYHPSDVPKPLAPSDPQNTVIQQHGYSPCHPVGRTSGDLDHD